MIRNIVETSFFSIETRKPNVARKFLYLYSVVSVKMQKIRSATFFWHKIALAFSALYYIWFGHSASIFAAYKP